MRRTARREASACSAAAPAAAAAIEETARRYGPSARASRAPLCRALALALLSLLAAENVSADPPQLYSQPYHQSPVRGAPDDLLLLAGYGLAESDTVVYRLMSRDDDVPAHPERVPLASTPEAGVAPIVSARGAPHSLTVRLPDALLADHPYALWARTAQGEWSTPVTINDARPLWFSPARVAATATKAGLSRYLKVIGRNLRPASGGAALLKLSGPEDFTLTAETREPVLDRYVARASLPALAPGTYRVAMSRDGTSWIEVADQLLRVDPDPAARADFPVSSPAFGACRAGDGRDDTACIARALTAARDAGGGRVVLGEGVWDLVDGASGGASAASRAGLVVPPGVDVAGAGAKRSTLVRHARTGSGTTAAALTLTGRNTVSGLTFRDAQRYTDAGRAGPFLRLGTGARGTTVEDVVITANVFDRTLVGLADSAMPVERLVVTHNEFGAFREGIFLGGSRFDTRHRFRLVDSIIAHNVFKPGSWLDEAARAGPIASEIGGAYRLDFSGNLADGAADDYLYSAEDARGWRAAFFWHMNENQEQVLVADNTATCTGDRIGDGEAIAYDNNGNTFGLDAAATVTRAGRNEVAIRQPLRAVQYGRAIDVADYYVGHWLQVGAGPGLGQVRKIAEYTIDADTGEITFTVTPAWDVVPKAGVTRISIGREFWQVYTIANTVEHGPPCLDSNRTGPKGGVISLWAQFADSVVEGNRQHDTDGILFQNLYSERRPDAACGAACDRGTQYVSFVEIRGNTISGEYARDDACSSSGIIGSLAAAPNVAPVTTGYGITIAHNRISSADARGGGAISFMAGWYRGPAPYRWPLVAGTLIHHNEIDGLAGPALRPCGNDRARPRTGIDLGDASLVTGTVLYANGCADAARPLATGGAADTVQHCTAAAGARDCGCARVRGRAGR